MESGTAGTTTADGWLNRALPEAGPVTSPLRAIAATTQMPRTLRGDRAAIAVNDAQQFQIGSEAVVGVLESLYAASPDARIGRAARDAFQAMKIIQSINQRPPQPAGRVQYVAGGELGRSLQQITRLIKANAGVQAAFAELGGWDHHQNENPQLSNLLRQFASALAAFSQDMGDRMEDIVVVTMSELGRTVAENGSGGTDHGHGSFMFVLGGAVEYVPPPISWTVF